MTYKERNKLSDRARIKQFLEYSIRQTCDDLSDEDYSGPGALSVFDMAVNNLLKFSIIYKNMGFDKEQSEIN